MLLVRLHYSLLQIELQLIVHRILEYKEVRMLPVISSRHYGTYELELAYNLKRLLSRC